MSSISRSSILLLVGLLPVLALANEAPARLTPREIAALPIVGGGTGTSLLASVKTTVLSGDPSKPGLYVIQLSVPANTRIKAHTHRDERSATVVSGTWYFGYGNLNQPEAQKALKAGSFYTEPAGMAHFAQTRSQPAVVVITGYGPSDTHYVEE